MTRSASKVRCLVIRDYDGDDYALHHVKCVCVLILLTVIVQQIYVVL